MKLLSTLRPETRVGRPVALTTLVAFIIATIPGPALASAAKPIEGLLAKIDQTSTPMPKSRLLTARMMRSEQGRTGENPYMAGQSKWDIVYKGINLMTGNYSTSGTDLTFEGGYGIPVNVTRSYSANSLDEGPLGKGWTLSVDVRSTAGGILKSGGAPVRAVPTNFKARPSTEIDPNAELATGQAAQPAEAVIATDAGGTEETIQVDADGVLTTPPWDKNTNETTYENVVQTDGSILRRTLTNKTFTPDGTVYMYARKGTYPDGVRPWDNPSAPSEPSDVMKIVSATDRQGNVTTYSYGADVSFQKANGRTTEARLTKIHMPNGHEISFTWANLGSTQSPAWRMTSATDGIRTVQYTYGTDPQDAQNLYNLTGVTTPGGKTTAFGYGGATTYTYYHNSPNHTWNGPIADRLLTTITDPRGLTTTICYAMLNGTDGRPKAATYRIETPNGIAIEHRPFSSEAYHRPGLYYFAPSTALVGGSVPTQPVYAGPEVSECVMSPRKPLSLCTVGKGYSNGVVTTATSVKAYYSSNSYPVEWLDTSNYSPATQDLLSSERQILDKSPGYTFDSAPALNAQRGLQPSSRYLEQTTRETTRYNFMGNPLGKTGGEYQRMRPMIGGEQIQTVRETSTEFAYWGADKYWQQKAVRDTSGRTSYTDYYTANDPQGSRGLTKKVYDAKYTTYVADPNTVYPLGVSASSPNAWKYNLVPQSDTHAARFEYDAKGRPTDVWKLQNAPSGGTYTYVQTHTVYGQDGDGSWGQASSVVEDYGGINRTTNTLHYDSIGRADKTQDAKGQIFRTNYDLDGLVQGIDQIVNGTATPVVSYTYGGSGLTNGQVLSVKDEMTGVEQSFGYCPSGGGKGMVSGIIETSGANTPYSTAYTYNEAGDRATSTITTPQGTARWAYGDYQSLGAAASPTRVFRTLARLDAAGNRTPEEFHYRYDSGGRLLEAAFAQTPSVSSATANGWYQDGSGTPVLAESRARAHYEYDAGGRLTLIAHYWDKLNSNRDGYDSAPIIANECSYETTGLKRGLKTASRFYEAAPNGTWTLKRTETYGYDPKNDQLTNANYGDGGANQVQSWGYDAAGNRISDSTQTGTWTYDNLNRILTSGDGAQYSHDILGNQRERIKFRQVGADWRVNDWDSLGRLAAMVPDIYQNSNDSRYVYAYRADGMRVSKEAGRNVNGVYTPYERTTYRYDGQMPIETVVTDGANVVTSVERNALGARGTDMIERVTSSGTQTRFPLYDAHGNSVGTLGRAGANSWTLGDERAYDAWGRVRQGGQAGAPSARYCASIGHVQDDESGFVYMRARYYEPGVGRFISEDHGLDGKNWYVYAANNPSNVRDFSGKEVVGPNFGPATGGLAVIFAGASAAGQWVGKQLFISLYKKMIEEGRGTQEGMDRVLEYWDSLAGSIFANMANAATGFALTVAVISGPVGFWTAIGEMGLAAGASFLVGMMTTYNSLVMLDIIMNWSE